MAGTPTAAGTLTDTTVIEASEGAPVVLPEPVSPTAAEYHRAGTDLVLTAPDGAQVVVRDFFAHDGAPDLVGSGGAVISGALAARLAGPAAPGQLAQAGPAQVAASIGEVDNVEGTVIALRTDGTRVELTVGDPVYQGDVLESGPGAAIGIVLADASTFSMAENGRMVLDEMVYDPGNPAASASLALSVVEGVFTFVSGEVAKTNPDAMVISTPVATIGIRGTQMGTSFLDGRNLMVVLMQEQDGTVGEVVVHTPSGYRTLNLADHAVMVSGLGLAPSQVFQVTVADIVEMFGGSLSVLPTWMGTGNDYGTQGDDDGDDAALADGLEDFETAAGTGGDTGAEGGDAIEEFFEALLGQDPGPGQGGPTLDTVVDLVVIRPAGSDTDPGVEAEGETDPAPTLAAGDGIDTITGGPGDDTLDGGGGRDFIDGRGGDDTLIGGSGDDTLVGGDGFDTASFSGLFDDYDLDLGGGGEVEAVTDTDGGDGNDGRDDLSGIERLRFADGHYDVATGLFDPADSVLVGGGGNDVIDGGGGNDFIEGGGGDDLIDGGGGDDFIDGGPGDDTLIGGDGNDIVNGGSGDDTFVGGTGAGDDFYFGDEGSDTVTFTSAAGGVVVSLETGTATGPDIDFDFLFDIENVVGSPGDDAIIGDGGANSLTGGGGGDLLTGGGGEDVVEGGDGDDVIIGDLAAPAALYLLEQDTVFRLESDGTAEVLVTEAEIATATGLSGAHMNDRGVAVDFLGDVYFSDAQSQSVLRKPADGGMLEVVATARNIKDATDHEFAEPKSLTFGRDGNLYLADDASDSLLRIDPGTGAVEQVVTRSEFEALPGILGVELAGGVVTGLDGTIYIASDGTDAVLEVDPATGTPGVLSSDPGFNDLDVFSVIAPNGDLLVADDFNANTIYRIPTSGADRGEVSVFLSDKNLKAVVDDGVDLEGGIAFDDAHNFYIAESTTNSVYRWTGYDVDTGTMDPDSGSLFVAADQLERLTDVPPILGGAMTFSGSFDVGAGAGGADMLTGGAGNDLIRGGEGDDVLSGSADDDVLIGGAGGDTMSGGTGADTFHYTAATDGAAAGGNTGFDRVTDFVGGTDRIAIAEALAAAIDDLDGSGTLAWAVDTAADFQSTHEALLLTSAAGVGDADLTAGDFAAVLAAINASLSAAGDGADGLIALSSTGGDTGLYHYEENGVAPHAVEQGELSLLAVVDDQALVTADFTVT